ncbi:MAG: hypothetical protein M5U01_24820 [Ardenticatenaceae bacterium]|nr:hypothetical protein [Ardenticatenaceae bacterium]
MIHPNCAHLLTLDRPAAIPALASNAVPRAVEVRSQVDPQRPLAPQVAATVDTAGWSAGRPRC